MGPFAPDKSLVQICGLYGYGTWAGARLTFEDHFYREIRGLRNFECLFRVQVHQRHLLKTDIIVLRELPRFEPPRSRINSLRGRWSRSGPPPPYGPTDIQLPSTGGDPPAD